MLPSIYFYSILHMYATFVQNVFCYIDGKCEWMMPNIQQKKWMNKMRKCLVYSMSIYIL